VESPGTAPGSDPIIAGAFIAIFTVARDTIYIGLQTMRRKGRFSLANPVLKDRISKPLR
jgi:hypothetical protein